MLCVVSCKIGAPATLSPGKVEAVIQKSTVYRTKEIATYLYFKGRHCKTCHMRIDNRAVRQLVLVLHRNGSAAVQAAGYMQHSRDPRYALWSRSRSSGSSSWNVQVGVRQLRRGPIIRIIILGTTAHFEAQIFSTTSKADCTAASPLVWRSGFFLLSRW